MLKFKVENQNIKLIETTPLVSGTVNEYECQFEVDESWEGYGKTAVFAIFPDGNCEHEVKGYPAVIEGDKCKVPSQLLTDNAKLKVGVYGVKDEYVKPTIYSTALLVRVGAKVSDVIPAPDDNFYQEIIQIMEDTKAIAQSVRDDADAGKFDGKVFWNE